MAGFADDATGNDVVYATNVDFSGNVTPQAQVTTNGQLLIGSTVSPNIRVGTLTSTGGTLAITNGSGTINLEAASSVPLTFTEQSGTAVPSANNINIFGTGSTTTIGAASTVTVQLTGLTNHNVLVGAGTATITNVAPAATGTVLTSNGASADPSFQAVSTPTTNFNPNATVNLVDDFTGVTTGGAANTIISLLSWAANTGATNGWLPSAGAATTSNSHPGVLQNTSTAVGNAAWLMLGQNGGTTQPARNFILGGGAITLNWVAKIITLSNSTNRYTLRFGLTGVLTYTTQNTDLTDGCYFEYSDNENSGNWVLKTASASTRTTANSSTTVDTNYHNFQITINAAATSVGFFVDGVQLANSPITTNIPTAALSLFYGYVSVLGTIAAGSIEIDLVYLTQSLTTPR